MTPPVLCGNGHRSLRGFPNPHDDTNTKKADRIPVRPFCVLEFVAQKQNGSAASLSHTGGAKYSEQAQ